MANKQIIDFPEVASIDATDFVHVNRAGADRKILASNMLPQAGNTGSVVVNTFVSGADYTEGSSNTVQLSQTVGSKNNTWIYFDGIYQEKSTYELSSALVIFDAAIPVGVSKIEVVMPLILPASQNSADNVTFGTTNVEEILNQTIVFNTVADMQTATFLSVGMKCRTLGYTIVGDGGDNDYEVVSSGTGTDDGGNFIDLLTTQARGIFPKGFRSPLQFGLTAVETFPNAVTTPSVEQGSAWLADGSVILTDFLNGRLGQILYIKATAATTIQAGANIVTTDGNDVELALGQAAHFVQFESGVWTQIGTVGGGGSSTPSQVVTEATSSRDLTIADSDKYIRFTSSDLTTVTVPLNASEPFSIGDEVYLRSTDGGVLVEAEGGVTINFPTNAGLYLADPGANATLKKVGVDEWDIFGLLDPTPSFSVVFSKGTTASVDTDPPVGVAYDLFTASRVAYLQQDAGANEYKLSARDAADFTQVGNVATLTATATKRGAVAALNSTDVCVVTSQGGSTDIQLRTYSFDGTDWSQVGNTFTHTMAITYASNNSHMSATMISPTRVVVLNAESTSSSDTKEVNTFDWDGTDWTLVDTFNPANTTLNTWSITTLDDGSLAMVAGGVIRRYTWNGSTWITSGVDFALLDNANDFWWKVGSAKRGDNSVVVRYLSGSGFDEIFVRELIWDGAAWINGTGAFNASEAPNVGGGGEPEAPDLRCFSAGDFWVGYFNSSFTLQVTPVSATLA